MRYRLRTLLVAIVLCAILANAIASGKNATKQVKQLDAAVMIALAKLNPEVSERFDVDYLFASDEGMSSYNIGSKTSFMWLGGFLPFPPKIERVVHVEEQAEVVIKIESRWYYLWSGTPEISIDFSPSRGNRWLAERLEAELNTSTRQNGDL